MSFDAGAGHWPLELAGRLQSGAACGGRGGGSGLKLGSAGGLREQCRACAEPASLATTLDLHAPAGLSATAAALASQRRRVWVSPYHCILDHLLLACPPRGAHVPFSSGPFSVSLSCGYESGSCPSWKTPGNDARPTGALEARINAELPQPSGI